jgi:DNA-binding winged helix-turn-helix (wHTH) protein/tetratricopeptide (TPR) repeat protein
MQYRWDDYRLEREGSLLTRHGRQVDVSRKVLDCITHLLAQRHRVVDYDDLSRAIWGHDDVTHHQLSQVILAARRALGDDGQTQRLIRTLPGIGYRWVGEVATIEDGATQLESTTTTQAFEPATRIGERHAPPVEEAPPTEPVPLSPETTHRASAVSPPRARRPLLAVTGIVISIAIVVAAIEWRRSHGATPATPVQAANGRPDPLSALRDALMKGQFEAVGEGLAALPANQADSPEARLLEIRLDIDRGRFDRAKEKLRVQQTRAAEAADPVWQSRLFSAQAILNGVAGGSGQDILAPAQSAVRLLESTGRTAPSLAMGEALSARGYGFMKTLQFEQAMRDLIEAQKLLHAAGDVGGAANAADTLARIHMRMGRFHEALALMIEIAALCERSGNPVQEIYARNAATKIQIELLRWNDALASNDRSLALLKEVPESERRTRVLLLRSLVLSGVGRMREAASLIKETERLQDDRYSPIPAATHHLAAGDFPRAMAIAADADAFGGYNANETLNLESREGALLLWLTAAQAQSADGRSIPPLPASRLAILQAPTSSIGHIARGRWLRSQGRSEEAEIALREAMSQARAMRHLSRMLTASEASIALLLDRGDTAGAERLLSDLWRYAPADLNRDYRANLLALRVALAANDRARAAAAYTGATAAAGERAIPENLEAAYRTSVGDGAARNAAKR